MTKKFIYVLGLGAESTNWFIGIIPRSLKFVRKCQKISSTWSPLGDYSLKDEVLVFVIQQDLKIKKCLLGECLFKLNLLYLTFKSCECIIRVPLRVKYW